MSVGLKERGSGQLNQIFIIIGSIIVAALVAVLVAPFFIDWSDHKAVFEREASALIGHPVQVKGEADAQFLPIPTFTFTNLEVGEPGGEPLMSASRLKIRLELIPLLQRTFDVIDMELDAPQISLRLREDGTTNWSGDGRGGLSGENFAFKLGPLTIRDGAVYAADVAQGKSIQLKAIETVVTAQSLIGPWKLEGTATERDNPFTFRIGTGKVIDGSLRVKALIEPQSLFYNTVFDGEIGPAEVAADQSALRYKGTMAVEPKPLADKPEKAGTSGNTEDKAPWGLKGAFELDRLGFTLTDAVFEDGRREAPLNLNGSVAIAFSPEVRFTADITSRQIDLDRAYGNGQASPLGVAETQDVLAGMIATMPRPGIPGEISVDITAVVVGGDVVRGINFKTRATDAGWRIDTLNATLPGATRLGFSGTVKTGPSMQVDGAVSLASSQPVAFARWWQPQSGDDARRLRIGSIDIQGQLAAETNAFRFTDLTATLGDSDISGSLSYARLSDRQKQFDATLSARKLDVDALQALGALFIGGSNLSGFGKNDTVALKLDAEKLVSATLEGRNASVDLKIANSVIDIRNLKIADFAGAEIDVSGTIRNPMTAPSGRVVGTVRAEAIEGLVKIAEAIAPGNPAVSYLRRNGASIVPVDVQVKFSGEQAEGRENAPPADFAATITGKLGGGTVSTGMRFVGDWQKPAAGNLEASFHATYADGAAFLSQIGWPAMDIGESGPAKVDLRANGTLASGLALAAEGEIENVKANTDLTVTLEENGTPRYQGMVKLKGDDGEPLLRLLGYGLPATGLGTDLDLSARIAGLGWNGTLNDVVGTIGGSKTSADLVYKGTDLSAKQPWKWSGKLAVERLSLPWILALATGEVLSPLALDLPAESETDTTDVTDEAENAPLDPAFWSQGQFSKPYLARLETRLEADLQVTSEAVDIGDLRELDAARFDLRLRPDSIDLDRISADFAGGSLNGSLRIANNEGAVTLSGNANLAEINAGTLLWSDSGRPLIEGKLSLASRFTGTGRSAQAVIATLSGGGSITLENAAIRRLNQATFRLLLEAADRDLSLERDTLLPIVEGHLDSGTLAVKKAESTFTIASGLVRIANTALENDTVKTRGNLTIDLPQMSLMGTIALSVDPAGIDATPVAGSTPEIAVNFDGPLDQPARSLDLQPLLGYLTVRRFENEVRRVEILQADILERQRLSRYARWISSEEEREQREAEEKAERERLEKIRASEEAARQKAEAAAREEKARAPDTPLAPINIEDELRRLREGRLQPPTNSSLQPNAPGLPGAFPPAQAPVGRPLILSPNPQ
ncbi:MAG: AsmA family protein [Rhizobiales bacterium]|nr:AsmA family protein [Hyphomicrobiales bacterium]